MGTHCKSPHDAIHKEGAALSSTDKRLANEFATDKSLALEGAADLRWIDAQYQIADGLTKQLRSIATRGRPGAV